MLVGNMIIIIVVFKKFCLSIIISLFIVVLVIIDLINVLVFGLLFLFFFVIGKILYSFEGCDISGFFM